VSAQTDLSECTSVWDNTCSKGRVMLSSRQIPMLSIQPFINPYILNYYNSSVIFVCRLEPFIAPFHYSCTFCLLYILRIPSVRIILSHLVH
jgi:hypothetical protein